jgi:uncharacterized protein YecT (DUF1311 family)
MKFWLLILSVFSVCHYAQASEDILAKANALYEAGEQESAKKIYEKAAVEGNAEAHFQLYYRYDLSSQDNKTHLTEAALQGHKEALEHLLDEFFFRATNLKDADPQHAFDIYMRAKQKNPDIKDSNIKPTTGIDALKKAVEAGSFDHDAFCQQCASLCEENRLYLKYKIEDNFWMHHYAVYSVWIMAEQYSRGKCSDTIDPKVVLQLVSRGGSVPAEVDEAVNQTYNNWKNNVVEPFDICAHITSSFGAEFCAMRKEDTDKKTRTVQLETFRKKLDGSAKILLDKTYKIACDFIELKTSNEELHDGSLRFASAIESTTNQKNEYIQLIEKIYNGFYPSPKNNSAHVDRKLNTTYQSILKTAADEEKKKTDFIGWHPPTEQELREVQRLWIAYRDASIKLFLILNPNVDKDIWQSWLTEIREKQLEEVEALMEVVIK